jgi:heme-degrading monooxygenase HmoA
MRLVSLRHRSQGTVLWWEIQTCTCGSLGQNSSRAMGSFRGGLQKGTEIRGEAKGLKSQWLLRDQNDPDAGYSISQWDSAEDMRAFWESKQRSDAMAVIQPFFVNQFTITNCEVRVAVGH